MNESIDRCEETQEQFIERYERRYPRAFSSGDMVAMPCTCEDGGGPTHWAAIPNIPEGIAEHLEFERFLAEERNNATPKASP